METDLKAGQKTKSYKDKMNIDIENMNTIEKKTQNLYKIMEEIYEVMQQNFLMKLTLFRMIL